MPAFRSREYHERACFVDGAEVLMKGAEKPKKVAKKVAQKSLKEKRADKRAAAASKPSSSS
jgi:hypothetical protein